MADRTRWLIDGMNLVGSRPDGWWADRPGAMRRLVRELADYAERSGDQVTVVFDGRPVELPAAPGLEIAFASRRGPNAADDDIAERVGRERDPHELRVVTSDRELAARVRERGGQVAGVSSFRRLLEPGT